MPGSAQKIGVKNRPLRVKTLRKKPIFTDIYFSYGRAPGIYEINNSENRQNPQHIFLWRYKAEKKAA